MNRLSTVTPATTAHSVPRRSSRTDVAKTATPSIGAACGASPVGKRVEPQTGGAAAPSAPNPFARADLWQAFRFTGYFQRETVAVFADSNGAVDFCLANIGTGNGFYVAEYRREAAHG